ncbi:MAG TPA: hypothetical protein VKX49_16585 [Bryobacteraceae bacterium]|nr:hypothetical protein [Bryobacteraceae bacterium]
MSFRAGSRVVYYAAILLVPAAVLWHRSDALFSPLWYADSWFYLGYFHNLVNFKRALYPDFYYGSRLSWILPGYLIHWLFRPLIANIILHLAAHVAASVSLFRILVSSTGPRAAFLTTLFYSVNPWVWTASGWDYPAGGAIAYLLLGIACLTSATETSHYRSRLIFAGAFLAASMFAQLFMGIFLAMGVLYYVGIAWARKYPLRTILPHAAASLTVGALAATVPLCLINGLLIDGNFWFWSPSFKTAGRVIQNYTWVESIWARGRLTPWLWFFLLAAALGLLSLFRWSDAVRRRDLSRLLTSLTFVLLFAFMAVMQALGFTWLGHSYYACYLFPFAFLVYGHSFFQAAEQLGRVAYLIACAGSLILAAALWYDPYQHPLPGGTDWLIAAFVIIAASVALRKQSASVFIAATGFAILTYGTYDGRDQSDRLHATADQYLRVMGARQHIEQRRNGTPILFWYDKQEPAFHEYFALNSTYMAEMARVSDHFPAGCPEHWDAGTMIAVISARTDAASTARSALSRCTLGLKVDVGDVFPVRDGPTRYTVSLLNVRSDYSWLRPLSATFSGSPGKGALQVAEQDRWLPLELWKAAPGTVQSPTTVGLDVRTPAYKYAYAMAYPALNVPVTGRYYFVVRYSLQAGHLAFGGFPADESRWLAVVKSRANLARHADMVFSLNLRQGDTIILRVANDNWYDRPSLFTIEATMAFLAPTN